MPDDQTDLGATRTGGEQWYEKRLWKRWHQIKTMPDYIALCDRLTFDADGFPHDFERLLENPEAKQIMERYDLLWVPHYDGGISKLSEMDMIELFGTTINLLCPPAKQGVVPLLWNGDFRVRVSDQENLAEVVDEYSFCNHVLLAIAISEGIPEAQIVAEVVELVRDLRESCGINPESRGKESVGRPRKLSDQLISLLRQEKKQGKSLKELVIEHWDDLASVSDKEYSPDEWGIDIVLTAAYKTLRRYLK